jgi:hypothetical protein
MKPLKIFLVSLFIHISRAGEVRKAPVSDDLNRACIIRFLQIRGKLDESVQSSPAPADLCRILLPLVYANHSERLCLRLWETKSVKAECVFETLKTFEFIDLELKFEIYSKTKNMVKLVRRKKIYEIVKAQREALTSTAKTCRSDYTYGGLFDEILGINSSLIALQKEHCLIKYATDNRFLDLPYMRLSSRDINIDVVNIQCASIIAQCQDESEERLMEAFKNRKYSSDAITCLLEKYKTERIFGWNLAKDLLFKLNISEHVKRSEDWRISKSLSDFNKVSANCLYAFNWSLFK